MLPTPSTSHISFSNIYEPSEDTYLLLDTLSSPAETAFLKSRFSTGASAPPFALEIGTGSGVVLAFLTAHSRTIVGRADVLTAGTDVNGFACRATGRTVGKAVEDTEGRRSGDFGVESPREWRSAVYLDALLADLASPLRPNMVDILVFNPPYVPTPSLPAPPDQSAAFVANTTFDQDSHLLSLSYAGGPDGMETTERLLQQLPDILSADRGVAYVLLCAQNKPDEVRARIRGWGGRWGVRTVGHSGKKAGWEKLQVLRIWRTGMGEPG